MDTENLKETLKRELPTLLNEDPAFRRFVLELICEVKAERGETHDWFHEKLDEIRRESERRDAQVAEKPGH